MSDRVPAWIEIGGPFPRPLLAELIACIRLESVHDDFGGGPVDPKTGEDLLALARGAEGEATTLALYDECVRNGEFAELEPFLENHGIAFNRHAAGGAEFSPERVRYRPGWAAPTTTLLDALDLEVILTENIIEALAMLKAGKRAAAIAFLAQLANEGVSELTPFELVD